MAKGEKRKLRKGQELRHGAPAGEVTLLLRGLCLYRFWDHQDKERVLCVILPNRTMGDIDAFCGNTANVSAYVVRDSTALVLPYEVWHREIMASTDLLEKVAANIIIKQESHIEALLACFSMDVELRIKSFFHALIKSYYPPKLEDWNPVPIRMSTVFIAKVVSTSRTSVSLKLNEWAQEGLLKKDGSMLVVHGHLLKGLYDWWES